jgi:hypothetical protein
MRSDHKTPTASFPEDLPTHAQPGKPTISQQGAHYRIAAVRAAGIQSATRPWGITSRTEAEWVNTPGLSLR